MNSKKPYINWIIKLKLNPLLGLFILLSLILLQCSCKKLVEAPPPTNSISDANAYSTDATAISVLSNIYILMNGNGFGKPIQGQRSISLLTGLSSDELTLYSGITSIGTLHYYQNALSATMGSGSELWAPLYTFIFKCNAAIEGLSQSKTLTPIISQQLLGEAKFMRAFFYFHLLNLFGDLPLCLSTDPQVNYLLERSSTSDIYQQIISDLLFAEESLEDNYLNGDFSGYTTERIRPTKWAAKALLAKVYLYSGDYNKAEVKATEIINNTTLYELVSLSDVFLKNSREAIWQLQPTAVNYNTMEATTYIIPATGLSENNPVYLSNYLLNSFEPGDQRFANTNWVDSIEVSGMVYYFPYKYKINLPNDNIITSTGTDDMTEYFMIIRLSEQYLIRAEARAQLENIIGSQNDLNTIRNRAGLTNTTANDKVSLLSGILHERQVELFTEGANRWFDLKRTGNIDAVMNLVTTQKTNGALSWQSFQQYYPLSLSELQKAPNLVQNQGY